MPDVPLLQASYLPGEDVVLNYTIDNQCPWVTRSMSFVIRRHIKVH